MVAISKAERRARKAPAKPTQSTVKSEMRVLRLLEFFSSVDHEVTVMQVARMLDFPQSSTSALLSRLVQSGYLGHDPRKRIYYPTARMALIGVQLMPKLPCGDRVLDLMSHISERTSGTVFLAGFNHMTVQTIHVMRPNARPQFARNTVAKYGIVSSTPGRMILSLAGETQASGYVRRHNAEAKRSERVEVTPFLERLKHVRACGYALSRHDEVIPLPLGVEPSSKADLPECAIPHQSRIAIALPAPNWRDTLALTVGCPRDASRTDEEDFARMVKGEVSKWMAGGEHSSPHLSTRQ